MSPGIGRRIPNHWTTRKVPPQYILNNTCLNIEGHPCSRPVQGTMRRWKRKRWSLLVRCLPSSRDDEMPMQLRFYQPGLRMLPESVP